MVEGRFHDASYGHWVLAVDALQRQPHTQQQFLEHSALADLYAAYQHVHAHVRQPFTALAPHTLLQAASCVLHSLSSLSQPQLPPGVSTAATLYVLATQADRLGAHATARQTYDALDSLHLPRAWRDAVGVRRLELRAGSSDDDDVEDPPEFLPLCYRCGLRGPLLARPDGGDRCQGCGHPFIRSMLTFEVLPLVEFAPDLAEVTTAEEALALLWAGVGGDDADGGGGEEKEGARRFNAGVARTLAAQQQQQHQSRVKSKGRRQSGASSASSTLPPPQYTPVLLGLRDLQSLRREEVFVVQAHRISSGAHELSRQQQPLLPPAPLLPPCRYYRNVLHPDVPLVLSQAAGRFCGEEAFEAAWLLEQEQDGTREWGDSEAGGGVEKDGGLVARRINPSCPFSRVRSVGDCG